MYNLEKEVCSSQKTMPKILIAFVLWAAAVSMVPCQGSEEIDECSINNGGCDRGTTCYDQPRGYVCHVENKCGFYARLSTNEVTRFTTPNHPYSYYNNADCKWTFAVPENHYVEIVTASGVMDYHDKFTISVSEKLDGSDPYEVQQLWGLYDRKRLVIGEAKFIFASFISDYSVTRYGHWCTLKLIPIATPNCGFKGVLSNEWTHLTTPNYPSHYPNNTYCKWNFEIPLYHDVQFLVQSGSTERYHDIFTVRRSGRSDGLHEVNSAVLHGDDIKINTLIYKVRFLSVIFNSDHQNTYQGLKASLRLVEGCGFSKTLKEGEVLTVKTPNFPDRYRMNDYCSWTMAVPADYDVEFQAARGVLEDVFMVKKSENIDGSDAVEVVSLNGEIRRVKRLISNARVIFVTFRTDRSREKKGLSSTFRLRRTTKASDISPCGFNAMLSTNWTYAATPNYPAKYTNNANCKWIFEVRSGYDVLLVIKRGKLEQGFDHFKVRKSRESDGSDETDVFEVKDGKERTKMIIYDAKFIIVTFTSDFSETYNGIEASLRLFKVFNECSINNGGCGRGTTCHDQPRGFICHVQKRCGFYATLSTDKAINITTPNYPENYNKNDDCSWTFGVAPNYDVEVVTGPGRIERYDRFKISESKNLDGSQQEEIFQLWGGFAKRRIVVEDAKFIFITFNSHRWMDTEIGLWCTLRLIPSRN